jgi:hypothetical protein
MSEGAGGETAFQREPRMSPPVEERTGQGEHEIRLRCPWRGPRRIPKAEAHRASTPARQYNASPVTLITWQGAPGVG